MSVHLPARLSASAPVGAGPAGNERLTATVAVVLLVLLAVEGVTILFLAPLLSVHLFVGLLLVPPVAVKLASTGWRFARYYLGSAPYRRRGPPHAILRAIAPVVVLSTAAVLGTGVALLFAGPASRDTLLPWHKATFIVWIAFTGVHVLAHLPALPRALRPAPLPGRPARAALVAGALLAGTALAVALSGHFAAWLDAGGG